jgi:putative hemolysin
VTSLLLMTVVGIAVCLLLEAFFSGTEMAMVNADRFQLAHRAEGGNAGAALALRLLESEDRLLGTCLIGTNLATVAGTTLVVGTLSSYGLELGLLAGVAYTPLTLILGESLPKTIFQHHADRLAPSLAFPLRAAQLVFTPGLTIVSTWSRGLDRLLGRGHDTPVSREEIVDLLDEDGEGAIADEDRRLILRVFEISETPVDEVMTPLVDVQAIADDATIAEASELAVESGHSRIPIYRERIDNIVGLVEVSALLFAPDPTLPVSSLMEPTSFVPESKRVDHLLAEMRQRRDSLVVVVDEYGGSVGIITIEDLLEEIVGEIRDERDEHEPAVQRLSEREWRVPARTEVDEFQDATGHELPEGDYETVAGFILATLGRIPSKGETLQVGPLTVFVEEASERAILSLRVIVPAA